MIIQAMGRTGPGLHFVQHVLCGVSGSRISLNSALAHWGSTVFLSDMSYHKVTVLMPVLTRMCPSKATAHFCCLFCGIQVKQNILPVLS